MTQTLTGSSVASNTITTPIAGELVTASSLSVFAQQLANHDRALSDGKFLTGSRSVTRAMDGYLFDTVNGVLVPPGFGLIATDGIWQQQIVAPHGATITAVTAHINPPNDGNVPGVFPTAQLVRKRLTDGTQTNISSAISDPNVTVSPYEAAHGFGPTALTEVVNRATDTYYLLVTGESGANKTAITFYGCTVTYTMDTRDDGI